MSLHALRAAQRSRHAFLASLRIPKPHCAPYATATMPAPTKPETVTPACSIPASAKSTSESAADPRSYYVSHPGAVPVSSVPKSWTFTSHLPPDLLFPTPASSHSTPRGNITPRTVRGALYTYVRPVEAKDPDLLAVSPAALRDLNISDPESEAFKATVAGNLLHGWDEEKGEGGYPWAQCYGGFQFGSWAGQLGDGRAISLFETTPASASCSAEEECRKKRALDYNQPDMPLRYELQLKGAGLTPYSRFADGKAVLRSSIREFVISEYLHALGIPTTRALSLVLLPHVKVSRERLEPGAMVCRFAQSWLRFGTFDLLRARGDRGLSRQLAEYVAEHVFGGWMTLPARIEGKVTEDSVQSPPLPRSVPRDECQGPEGEEENRFTRLYREIVRRNARTVARWQAYGFMNGVLNTDNTSVYGLSIDFGPFAFMDAFDPNYTPNHDDFTLRYSFKNQPTIIWWNIVRLGEALGELMGAGPRVDDLLFVEKGVRSKEEGEKITKRAESIILRAGEEYRAVFMREYKEVMTARLGLKSCKQGDFEELLSEALDILAAGELDFQFFFRRLGKVRLRELATVAARGDVARRFYYDDQDQDQDNGVTPGTTSEDHVRTRMGRWLGLWAERVREDWGDVQESSYDGDRMEAMRKVNPNFVPRGWVLDEVIRRVEKGGERDVLRRLVVMSLNPFEDEWTGKEILGGDGAQGGVYHGDRAEEERWTGNFAAAVRAMQCSCSS